MIPMKWAPYFIIALGIFGTIVLAVKGGADAADTIFGIVVCVLAVVGGVVWICIKKKKR